MLHIKNESSYRVREDLFSDRRVRIHCQGAPEDHCLYSLADGLAAERAEDFARSAGFSGMVFMPWVASCNAKIAPRSAFRQVDPSTRVFNSAVADGVVISGGQAAVFATGDCPTVVMHLPGERIAVAAHAGRKSLIGSCVMDRWPGCGVVFEMAELFSPSRRSDIEVAVILGIDGRHFAHHPDDPCYAESNRAMIEFVSKVYGEQCFVDLSTGSLSLLEVIKVQCEMAGIPRQNVRHDDIDTFSDKLPSGAFAFHSNRRYELERKEKGLPSKVKARNIVLVELL